MSWLGKRVRVIGTEIEGNVVAITAWGGEPLSLRVVRPAMGRRLPVGGPKSVRMSCAYLPDGPMLDALLGGQQLDQGDLAANLHQAFYVYEDGVEVVGPPPPQSGLGMPPDIVGQPSKGGSLQAAEEQAEAGTANIPTIDFGPTPVVPRSTHVLGGGPAAHPKGCVRCTACADAGYPINPLDQIPGVPPHRPGVDGHRERNGLPPIEPTPAPKPDAPPLSRDEHGNPIPRSLCPDCHTMAGDIHFMPCPLGPGAWEPVGSDPGLVAYHEAKAHVRELADYQESKKAAWVIIPIEMARALTGGGR